MPVRFTMLADSTPAGGAQPVMRSETFGPKKSATSTVARRLGNGQSNR